MPPDKHFRCTVCQRGFTRVDHLKRHHLRHSGQKPYSCVFCNETFARCDNLRDHYTDCAQRGDRKIPETGQRGRRRHACHSCTSMKLRCDGQSPCGSCVKRSLQCNNGQPLHPGHPGFDTGSSPSIEAYEQPSDRGSIKFLLNGGTDSFTEDFRLPPRGDRARGLVWHNQAGLQEAAGVFPYNVHSNRPHCPPSAVQSDPVAFQFFQDNFLELFNGPLGEGQKPIGVAYPEQMPFQAPINAGQDPNLAIPPANQAIFEPEQPFASALINSIYGRVGSLPEDSKSEIRANLISLLTTARIRKFVGMYFKYWQPSCAMIHIPSFDLGTVSLPLLAVVVFMGAMYSTDQREVYVAKRILDFVELFVFSSDIYSADVEIATTFSGAQGSKDEKSDWVKFQNFQAGFIITIIQYWAGSRASRNRAMESRFGEVVKLARRLDLVKCRHLPHEQSMEQLWIQTECRIRTVSIVSLLDCAFLFYQNYPCRLTHSEMECDLPCDEAIFRSEHPFTEPNFRFSRNLTIYEAFQNLFDAPILESPQRTPDISHMDLTVLDMFILIHILFAFINTHMTLVGLLKRHTNAIMASHIPIEGGDGKSMIPEDSLMGSIRMALARWRDHWIARRDQVSSDEWASMGFYKNGYNFWLVSQLLITKKDAVDVIMQMEVKCEDKLEKLKVLLLDERD